MFFITGSALVLLLHLTVCTGYFSSFHDWYRKTCLPFDSSVVGNSFFFLVSPFERGEFVKLPRVQNCSFLKRARPKACQAFAKHKQ
jgi:hypothetical protein